MTTRIVQYCRLEVDGAIVRVHRTRIRIDVVPVQAICHASYHVGCIAIYHTICHAIYHANMQVPRSLVARLENVT